MSMAQKPRPKFNLAKGAQVPAAPKPPAKSGSERQANRQGKRVVSVFVEPEVWMQLKMVSVRSGTTLQDLMIEAVDLLFQQHGAPRIARD